jgi:hypothetical protein
VDDIKALCVKRIPSWKNIPYDRIFVHPIKAALSNTIIYVKVAASSQEGSENKPTSSPATPAGDVINNNDKLPDPYRCIVRFYGRASSFFFDSNHERIIARLLPSIGRVFPPMHACIHPCHSISGAN